MLAQRIAVQYVLPGRLLMVTATKAAGSRFIIAGLIMVNVLLAMIIVAEKTFGLKRRLQRTLRIKSDIEGRLNQQRERESMLELVLRKSRANLGSLSSIDEDQDDGGIRGSASCPLCHGTGKIVYEGKMRHEDPCPRCALLL
jgi:hypothetical protein